MKSVLLKLAGALLAVGTFIQLEVKTSHTIHIVVACVVVGLTYLLGRKDEGVKSNKEEVKI